MLRTTRSTNVIDLGFDITLIRRNKQKQKRAMKLRSRPLNGSHDNEEGDDVRLDGRRQRNCDSTCRASYEFESITVDISDDEAARSKVNQSSEKQSEMRFSLDRVPSRKEINECGSPNTTTTKCSSIRDEHSLDAENEGIEAPHVIDRRSCLQRTLSAKGGITRGSDSSRRLSARNIVRGVPFRKNFRKEHSNPDNTSQPCVQAVEKRGIFGGRRRRDHGDLENHIGEIKVSKHIGEIKITKAAPATKVVLRNCSGESKVSKKASALDQMKSCIGEIKTKETPPSLEMEYGKSVCSANPSASSHESDNKSSEKIMDQDLDNDNEDKNETDIHPSQCKTGNLSSFSLAGNASDCSHSFHDTDIHRKSGQEESSVQADTGHTELTQDYEQGGQNSFECRSISSSDESFADDMACTGSIEQNEDDDRPYIFEDESKIPHVHRETSETFSHENIIFQYFVDKENPVVWILDEEDDGPTRYLELNVSFATQVAVANKPRFRISGLTRASVAA